MNTEIKDQKINWDNSYIGEIDSLVSQNIEDKKYTFINLKYTESDNEKAILYNFDGFIPLICEEFKSLFKLRNNGKHIVKYKNKHMLMVKHKTQTNLKDYLKVNNITIRSLPDYIKKDVKNFIAFRYLFCLKTINESSLDIVFEPSVVPYIINNLEQEINYKSKISQRLIDDWFDNTENFHQFIKTMIGDNDVTILKFQIQKIIEKYDKGLIGWSNIIYNRFLQIY